VPSAPTVSSLFINPLLQTARSLGVNVDAALRAAGISRKRLVPWDARIPVDACCELTEDAARQIGDQHLGLHLAERLPIGSYDVYWYAVANSPTVKEALEKLVRYHRIISDAGNIGFATDPKVARMSRQFPQRKRDRFVVQGDHFLAYLILRMRQLSGVDFTPREVRFQHGAPQTTADEAQLFRAPLRFDHWGYELLFDSALLGLPVRPYDSSLAKVLDRYASEIMERLPTHSDTVAAVRRLVADELRGGVPSLGTIARRLGMSERTLQRVLAREHASFQREVDHVRRQLAERILDEGDLSITETAFLLGFADVSSFHRAFRRWTGQTPSEFRRPAKARAGPRA
jgi:AraC-like DNA-binding protein